jgi:hypothetical protein
MQYLDLFRVFRAFHGLTSVSRINASAVLADKAYDKNELREWLNSPKIKAFIPPKSNRKEEIECYGLDETSTEPRQYFSVCILALS